MKRIANKIILGAVVLTSAVGLLSSTVAETPKLRQFHMALLKKGPKWKTTPAAERNKIMQQHLANVLSMLDSEKAVIAGPMGDDTAVAGIFILRAQSAEEAKGWVDADPAVKSGLFAAEMHPWWSGRYFQRPHVPLTTDASRPRTVRISTAGSASTQPSPPRRLRAQDEDAATAVSSPIARR